MENEQIEYKSAWQDSYLKTICAFANTNGGELLVGIDDIGNVVGLQDGKKLLEDIPNKTRNRLGITPKINIDERNVLVIEVEPSDVPVSYDGKFYIRSGSTTQELKGHELIKFLLKKKNLGWDALTSDMPFSEIDAETIQNFIALARNRLKISEKDDITTILENLELAKDKKITNAGALLFGKNPHRYTDVAWARVGRFKTPTDILDTVLTSGNLFQQLNTLFEAVKKHLNVRFVIKGELEREDVWDYPLDAIREAIINALIHRDYLDTAEIQIKVFDDRIWIWSPGTLPEGITLDMLKTVHGSKPRNKLLAMAFYYAGLIERWGSGTRRMVDLCLAQGLPEPVFKEEMSGFSVIFFKDIYTEEYLRKMDLNERQIKAVMYVKEKGKITNREYQEICATSERTATRDLSSMVSIGLLDQIGTTGKGTEYVLSRHKDAKGATKTP